MAKNYFDRYVWLIDLINRHEYTVYRYHLAPTLDFMQELFSRGPAVQVLAPEAFRLEVMDDVAAMAKNYGL